MPDNSKSTDLPRVPDHELLRRIGGGSYGEVWLARNEATAEFRAIKIIRRDRFADDRPFQREFEGIRRFEPISRQHPGLVDVLHVGKNDQAGHFYCIMEVADDLQTQQQINAERYRPKTLASYLEQSGPPRPLPAMAIALALTCGLDFLHRQHLLHRDIKPSNIIFVRGEPKFADIGLVVTQGEPNTRVGTPIYMPPEGFRAPNSDIFSLGKVLYTLFLGKDAAEFPDVPKDWKQLGDEVQLVMLYRIICRACEADPLKRYQSAAELCRELAHAGQMPCPLDGPAPTGSGPGAEVGMSEVHVSLSDIEQPVTTPVEVDAPDPQPPLVTILHKSGLETDEGLLRWLETKLAENGFRVFSEKRRTIGPAWVRQLEKRIRDSDALVVLLSDQSLQSDLLIQELEMASQAAQEQQGKPRLLPVRVHSTVALPAVLEGLLFRCPTFAWQGEADNERLLAGLLKALGSSGAGPVPFTTPDLEPPGGAVPLDSAYYVVRPTDHAFQSAIDRHDSIVLVKGARQIGKTSLLARGLQQARASGARVILTDFQKFNARHLASIEDFFLTLSEFLAEQLDLSVMPNEVWDARRSPNMNFERYMRRQVLTVVQSYLVWGLDEVDRLFMCDFGSEVFGLFRSWHNDRALDPTGPWSRLTLAIAYATEAHLFIQDLNQSPFNVGTRLALDDFTLEQVQHLNRLHGSPLTCAEEVKQFYELLGGQPYLVRRGLNELTETPMRFADFVALADRDEGIFADHLRRLLVLLVKDESMLNVVHHILAGAPCPDNASFYRLRSAGVIKGDTPRQARLRCGIYASYLRHYLEWTQQHPVSS